MSVPPPQLNDAALYITLKSQLGAIQGLSILVMLHEKKNSFDVDCYTRLLWRTLQLPNCKGTPGRAIPYQGGT